MNKIKTATVVVNHNDEIYDYVSAVIFEDDFKLGFLDIIASTRIPEPEVYDFIFHRALRNDDTVIYIKKQLMLDIMKNTTRFSATLNNDKRLKIVKRENGFFGGYTFDRNEWHQVFNISTASMLALTIEANLNDGFFIEFLNEKDSRAFMENRTVFPQQKPKNNETLDNENHKQPCDSMTAFEIANALFNAPDLKFAEIFALIDKMHENEKITGIYDESELVANYPYENLIDWLSPALQEIKENEQVQQYLQNSENCMAQENSKTAFDKNPFNASRETVKAAEEYLIHNGVDSNDVQTVLQTLGHIFKDSNLYDDQTKSEKKGE